MIMGETFLTEAEQNRLIQENIQLPGQLAEKHYSNKKGIPAEDLNQQATIFLVVAARNCRNPRTFPAYAEKYIKAELLQFINGWQTLESLDGGSPAGEKLIYEWQNFLFALYEQWETDPHSPESLLIRYQDLARLPKQLADGLASLTAFERSLVRDYFVRQLELDQVARNHLISYKRANETIYRALAKMRDRIVEIESNKRQKAV